MSLQTSSAHFSSGFGIDEKEQLLRNYEIEDQLHQRLIRDIDESVLHDLEPEQVREQVERATRILASGLFPELMGDAKESAIEHVVDEVTGLGPIQPLLRDNTISEIMINGPKEVYYERNGIIYESELGFRDQAHIYRIIDHIVAAIGRHVDEASPMVDARWQDGSRVNIVIPPLAPKSPIVTIRKFLGDRYAIEDLIEGGTLSKEMGQVLEGCIKARLNMVISGGTGSGKTTLMNSISAFMSSRERIVTVEDPLELKLQQKHVVSLEARPASSERVGEVNQRDLVRKALRMRPDRIIVGEVRGAEAFDMLQAMNTGHDGSITTVHANSPRDALSRIENMVLMAGLELPVRMIHEQIASALDVIVQISRLMDGSRKVVQVTEVAGMEGDQVSLQEIFKFEQTSVETHGTVRGNLSATGIRPKFAERLEAYGVKLPDNIFNPTRWS